MSGSGEFLLKEQQRINKKLLKSSKYVGDKIESKVIPFSLDPKSRKKLTAEQIHHLELIQKCFSYIILFSLCSRKLPLTHWLKAPMAGPHQI